MLLLSNLKLVIYLFGALVFSSMSWLYFDAMAVRPQKSVLLRALGAMILGIAYLGGAVLVEGTTITWLSGLGEVIDLFKILGYLILIMGVWSEPLSKRPNSEAVVAKGFLPVWLVGTFTYLLPVLPALVGLGYLRRASVGLERHLKGMAFGMYTLSIAEILDLRRLYVESSDVRIYDVVREFGPLWIVQLLVLLAGFWMISRWVFGYLLKRFETQITLFMGMLVMSVFAVATTVFTYVMSSQLEQGALRETNSALVMIKNNWAREGDELSKVGQGFVGVDSSDKEQLAKMIGEAKYQVKVLDTDFRDVVSGEKIENLNINMVGKIGYQVSGIGSARKVLLQSVIAREGGFVLTETEMGSAQLEKSAQDTGMALRIYHDETVVGASAVPGYPDIPSPLGLIRQGGDRLGGINYTMTREDLTTGEGVKVAELETAMPISELWKSVGTALAYTYMAGVLILILMELPAIGIAKYLTRQLQ